MASVEFKLKTWTQRRLRTSRVFYMQSLINGIEYSLTFTNLYLYLKQVIKTDHIVFHYSAISTVFLLSMIVSSLILGRIFDRYRNTRTMLFLANFMMIIGNTMYTIPVSPWLLFAGRLIAGVGSCVKSLLNAETARSYTEQEVLTEFSRLGMAFGLGFIAGPGINFAFVKADFQFLGVHIMFANGASLVLIFVLILQLVLVFLFVSNLSKEYDLKEAIGTSKVHAQDKLEEPEEVLFVGNFSNKYELKEVGFPSKKSCEMEDDEEDDEGPDETQTFIQEIPLEEQFPQTFFKPIKTIDMILIMIMSAFFMNCYCVYDIWQPMAAVKYLDWGIFEINFVNFGYGGFSMVTFAIFMFISPSQRTTAYITIVCFLCNVLILSIFLIWKAYNRNNTINTVLSVLFVASFAIALIMEEVFLPSVLASRVPSHKQAFTEGVRQSFARLGSMFGLLFAASMFHYLEYVCVAYITVVFILLVFFIWRLNRIIG